MNVPRLPALRARLARAAAHVGRGARLVTRAILGAFDARDVHFYGGLAIAGAGGWLLSHAWTLIVVGAVLALVGLLGPRPRA